MIGYKEMADFEYTDAWEDDEDFDSDSVEYVWYNRNTQQVAVEWMDSVNLYVYDGVPFDVVNDAVCSYSVGAAVAKNIKQVYGPGRNLGDRYELDLKQVETTSTKEFSLQVPVSSNRQGPAAPTTKEFSLQTPAAAPVAAKSGGLSLTEGEPVYTLTFDHDGAERTFVTRKADNWEDSLDRLDEFARSVGLDIKVTKVTVTFE